MRTLVSIWLLFISCGAGVAYSQDWPYLPDYGYDYRSEPFYVSVDTVLDLLYDGRPLDYLEQYSYDQFPDYVDGIILDSATFSGVQDAVCYLVCNSTSCWVVCSNEERIYY